MMQKEFIDTLRRNPRKIEPWRLAVQLASDAAAILGLFGFCYFAPESWPRLVLAPVVAILCFRSFSMMHDCSHAAASNSARVNRWVGELYGILCFLPFRSWRELHLDHHRYTGNIDKDPSMAMVSRFRRQGYRTPMFARLCWRSHIPVMAFLQHMVFWRATLKSREFPFVVGAALFWTAVIGSLGPLAFFAAVFLYLYGVEIVNFPHHLGLPQFDGDAIVAPKDQHAFARTCIYPNWIARHVILNFNYHIEHHLYPAYPWYQLDRIHAELARHKGSGFVYIKGNEWIRKNRSVSIDSVFLQTFAGEKASAPQTEQAAAS